MRKIGTIMVRSERGVLVHAMRPNVQISAMRTEPAGINTPRRLRKRRKRTRAMRRNVMGGSLMKSCSVNCVNAIETTGMPIWYMD